MSALVNEAYALFAEHFGGVPTLVAAAPGRVNLIGEHTDYNDGFVLPMAIDRHTLVAARRRDDGMVHVVAGNLGGVTTSFAVADAVAVSGDQAWSNYVRGMVALLPGHGVAIPGADIAISGDMPQGAGLSSSAALENAVGLALAALDGQADLDRSLLARIGQQTEHAFAGCQCGIMDQLVSARAEAGRALLIDCRSLDVRAVKVPSDMAVLIVHSGVVRGLVDGEYNLRRSQCEAAARHFGVPALRDIDRSRLDSADAAGLDPQVLRRARHVVSENARVMAMVDALEQRNLAQIGALMAASHASMRDDFSITVPPIDDLVTLLQRAIGDQGGARMTGGGFGGAVVALVSSDHRDSVMEAVRRGYRTPLGSVAEMMVVQAVSGAHIVIDRAA